MSSVARAWLLDPVALLFLLSLFVILALITTIRQRSRGRGRRYRRRSRGVWAWPLFILWLGVFLFSSAPAIVNPMLARLEDPYRVLPYCDVGSHVIVLGGGVDTRVLEADEFERMDSATLARAGAVVRLLADEPDTRVIVAGGAFGTAVSEAELIANWLTRSGIDSRRIVQENESGNTRENALNVAEILAVEQVDGPVRLVTSALHMSRALQSFRRVLADRDIIVCPVSVDVRALKDVPVYALMPQTTAIAKFDSLLHEWVALLVYRSRGWL